MTPRALSLLVLGIACRSAASTTEVETWADADARARAPVESAPGPGAHPTSWDLVGGTVWTAAGTAFSPGRVVVEQGRVTWVGPAGEGPACASCVVLDVSGRWVTPGIIDTHSHLGVYPSPGANAHEDGNEMTAPTTPGVWAESSVWPYDPGFQRAVAGGVTALQVLPGSANLIGGRGVVLRPIPARGGRAMRFPGAPETVKLACGENPKRVYGERGGPSTRMGNIRGYREAFFEAQRYLDAWNTAVEDGSDPPARDADLDTLAGLLSGTILAQVHCYRSDDMLSFLQVADEAGFHVRSFHHALEAYKIRDILAEREVASSTWDDWWGFKLEAWDAVQANAAMLTRAGARAVIHSDSEVGIQRLNQEAGKAQADGADAGFAVSDDEALQWITANAAWTLGIEGETGTIEPGKRGDLVVWDHHPFSVYAQAQQVWIDGALVHDAMQPTTWSDHEVGR